MTLRERPRGDGESQRDLQQPNGGAGGDNLARIRSIGEDFLRAGDEAIQRALSANSAAFLAASRQQGGE
jgi:hypothetical protein